MGTRRVRSLGLVAGIAWLVVAGSGLRSAIVDDGDGWEVAYLIFSVALLVGAAFTVALVGWSSGRSDRPRLRMAGLAVSGVGVAAAFVAWALPLWMTVLGVGFAMVALSGPGPRRAVTFFAAGQLAGLVTLIAAITAEVGRRDEWGDYPVAGGIALVVTATITIVALYQLMRSVTPPAVAETDAGPQGAPQSTAVPYISPSGSAMSSRRAPSGSRK